MEERITIVHKVTADKGCRHDGETLRRYLSRGGISIIGISAIIICMIIPKKDIFDERQQSNIRPDVHRAFAVDCVAHFGRKPPQLAFQKRNPNISGIKWAAASRLCVDEGPYWCAVKVYCEAWELVSHSY